MLYLRRFDKDMGDRSLASQCRYIVREINYRNTENAKEQKYRNAKSQKYKRGEAGGLDEKMMQRAVRSVAAFVHKWADSISRANMAGNRRIPPPCQQ